MDTRIQAHVLLLLFYEIIHVTFSNVNIDRGVEGGMVGGGGGGA